MTDRDSLYTVLEELKEDILIMKEDMSSMKEDMSSMQEDINTLKTDSKELHRKQDFFRRELLNIKDEIKETKALMTIEFTKNKKEHLAFMDRQDTIIEVLSQKRILTEYARA